MAKEAKSFPTTYAQMGTEELMDIYAAAPDRLNAALTKLNVRELQVRPEPDKWSIQEVALHMTDAEIIGAARIRQVAAESGSALADYDASKWTEVFDYRELESKEFYAMLILFDSLRLNTLKIFQRAENTTWNNVGHHPKWGEVTLRQLLELYADHSERHLSQIIEVRQAINKPIDFPILLPDRLF